MENLNLVELLRGCEGTTLYSTVFGTVTLDFIRTDGRDYPIQVLNVDGMAKLFGIGGKFFTCGDGECVLFPSKDQRDWSKFKKPLGIDTPCMVSNGGTDWLLRFYSHDSLCFIDGFRSTETKETSSWIYIVPVKDFDFYRPELNKTKSIM